MYEDEVEIDPEEWERGWEMDADEGEELVEQYLDLLRR